MSLDGHLDVTVNEAVEFALTVENASLEPLELEFRSGLVADFVVCEGGDRVWRWSEERMFTQALQHETLGSGESVTYTGTWRDPESGAYTAKATLEAVNASLEVTQEFAVD